MQFSPSFSFWGRSGHLLFFVWQFVFCNVLEGVVHIIINFLLSFSATIFYQKVNSNTYYPSRLWSRRARALSVHAKLWIKGKEAQPPSLWYRGLATSGEALALTRLLIFKMMLLLVTRTLSFEVNNTFLVSYSIDTLFIQSLVGLV